MQNVKDKHVVVIGGGSGIGRGIALAFGQAGAQVTVADIDSDTANTVAEEIQSNGSRAVGRAVDGTNPKALEELATETAKSVGPVHILSNNVGVVINKSLASCTDEDWGWGIEFNLMSIVRSVAAFLPHLREHGEESHIVNTASLAGVLAIPSAPNFPIHLGIYTATKHAVVAYSEMLRGELAPDRIGVSVLCPGMVQSNLAATSARNRPERFGGPLPEPGAPPPEAQAIMMPAERVGSIVVASVRANRLHVFPHPDARAAVEARQKAMLEDFSFAAEDAKNHD